MIAGEEPAARQDRYLSSPNKTLGATGGIRFVYRELGQAEPPLVLLQHFRGNLDNWDPALLDLLASDRRVIAFDNVGVGGSTGSTPSTFADMARDALAFLDALGLAQVDLLGFSIGSFVAQELALLRPAAVRRLVLASSAPRGAPGMHGWAPDVIAAVGGREPNPEGYLRVFYTSSAHSSGAGKASLERMLARTEDKDEPTDWATRQAQYDAVCSWGVPDHSALERVSAITAPVFVANGDSDPMIRPRYSHLLAGLIPLAQVRIYPDAAHGFLFQHHEDFARDVLRFLTSEQQEARR